jgi:hypothetical protein
MLFRRIIQHLRKQEWTAVAIDFLIVVVGVFIGLQVNDWGAAQADQRRGREYVERLIQELEKDLAGRWQLVVYYDEVYASAERANALLGQASPDPAELVVNAYRATEFAHNPPTRATWDEIVSAGDLGLLPRRAIESGLSDYYSFDTGLAAVDSLAASAYRRLVRRVIPHEVQRAIREGCGDVRDANQIVVGFQPVCRLDVGDAQIAAAARSLQGAINSRTWPARANLRGDVAFLEGALAALRDEAGP